MLAAVAPHLELFVIAERDAQYGAGLCRGPPSRLPRRLPRVTACRSSPSPGPSRICGVRGDLLLARGTVHYAPRYPVEIVDRIGAGDFFVGGLIHGLLDGDFDLAIRLAAYAAAIGARHSRRHQPFRAGGSGRVRRPA